MISRPFKSQKAFEDAVIECLWFWQQKLLLHEWVVATDEGCPGAGLPGYDSWFVSDFAASR